MRFPNIFSKVYADPWLILPDRHRAIQTSLEAHMGGDGGEPKESALLGSLFGEPEPIEATDHGGGVVSIPLSGIIGKRLSNLEINCGGCDLDHLRASVERAIDRHGPETLVLDIDSPGGTVVGVKEFGDFVRELAGELHVVAYSETMVASAAYWIAAQADEIIVAETAAVGSIGVYLAFLDRSRQLEASGLKLELFKAGKLKAAGHPLKETSEDEREYFQERIDAVMDMFREAVSHRDLDDPVMQGQVFYGREAEANGLADGIAPGLATVVRHARGRDS